MKPIDQNVTFCSGLKIIDCAIRFFKPIPTTCCHMRGLIRPSAQRCVLPVSFPVDSLLP